MHGDRPSALFLGKNAVGGLSLRDSFGEWQQKVQGSRPFSNLRETMASNSPPRRRRGWIAAAPGLARLLIMIYNECRYKIY